MPRLLKISKGAAEALTLGGAAVASVFKDEKRQTSIMQAVALFSEAAEKGISVDLGAAPRRRRPRKGKRDE